MLKARLWECLERDDLEQLKTLPVLMALYLEQLVLDLSAGTESQIPWFLTGLPIPEYHLMQDHKSIQSEELFAALASPKWIHANLSYLRDLDFYQKRQHDSRTSGIPSSTSGASSSTPSRRAKAHAKKAKAKA